MAPRRNILLIHQGALGDFVLTWPIALALARIHPQSRVFYVTQSQKGKLAEKALGVEWVDGDAGWHPLYAEGASLADAPAKLLAGAHSVVNFSASPDDAFATNVLRLAPDANLLSIDPRPPGEFAGHVTEFQLEQLRPWPAAHAAAEQIVRSINARGVGVSRPATPAGVVVHPGSGSPQKNWPLERYLDLIARVCGGGHEVRVVLGEVEQERWPQDAVARLNAAASTVIAPATYLELMTELATARAFVGNDSGPGHLAGVLGVPTLILFGPTDPARWKPLGPRVNAMRGEPLESLESLDVARVAEALRALTE